jgi:hypothetical protein
VFWTHIHIQNSYHSACESKEDNEDEFPLGLLFTLSLNQNSHKTWR